MKKVFTATLITLLFLGLAQSCSLSLLQSQMIEDAYRIVKKVVFTSDSVEIHLKEKEIYFEFEIGQELDTTLEDKTEVWLRFDKARNKYLISIFEPSTQFKIKKK